MKLNLPNKITLFRIILVIPLIVFFSLSYYYSKFELNNNLNYNHLNTNNLGMIFFIVASIIFIIAMISDFLDGYIARKKNQVTTFGKLLDPLSDKIITSTTMLFLVLFNMSFFYIFLIFLIRDLIVDGFRNLAAKNNLKIEASIFGKLKTVFQTIGIVVILFISPFFSIKELEINNYYLNIPLFIASLLSIISGFLYVKILIPYINK
ncbi:MAG: CDP-diacylglycerol--glycerol-3-phosphate 3-phosphatidyltransferase [Metamycoplasmataceae bacterium]